MHWIDKYVLRQLIQNQSLRYGEIKPSGVEGSLFMYHLRQLKKAGLVQKNTGNHYELTPNGRLQADKLQLETLKTYEQPRIVVLVACWDEQKGLLLFKRRTQPVINMVGFPHLNIHLGKQLVSDAEEEFNRASGLKVKLKRRGDGYITMYRDKSPESYIFFHLLEGRQPSGDLVENSETGTFFWQKSLNFAAPEYMPSMDKLIKLLSRKTEEPFFIELEYNLPKQS